MLVSAVIVNWNTGDLLRTCLESLQRHPPPGTELEIIVVDNGSGDGSVEMLRTDWPEVRVIANQENRGFARANNQAIPLARGEHLLLINADAALLPGALDRMLERMEEDPKAGAVGPRLVYGDGRWQRWTAGREPSLGSVGAYLLVLDRIASPWAEASLYLARDVDRAFQPDWVSSACMLVRRGALLGPEGVGLLDERYFCYMDDVDLCRRLRLAGWNVWYEPAAEAVHLMGQSSRRQTGAASPAALRNFNDYFGRIHGWRAGLLLRLLEVVGFGARAVAYGVASLLPHRDYREGARTHLQHVRISLKRGYV